MRLFCLFLSGICCLYSYSARAASAQDVLQKMIASDMAGDPTLRISLAAPNAKTDEPNHLKLTPDRITFWLNFDALELATAWHVENSAGICSTTCEIPVVYHVVGTTVGSGESFNLKIRPGREIVPLKTPFDRAVMYTLVRIDGAWKIKLFPKPYVNPKSLIQYYEDNVKLLNSVPKQNSTVGEAAYRNRQLGIAWDRHELSILMNLPS